jgi:hypothetical protein
MSRPFQSPISSSRGHTSRKCLEITSRASSSNIQTEFLERCKLYFFQKLGERAMLESLFLDALYRKSKLPQRRRTGRNRQEKLCARGIVLAKCQNGMISSGKVQVPVICPGLSCFVVQLNNMSSTSSVLLFYPGASGSLSGLRDERSGLPGTTH